MDYEENTKSDKQCAKTEMLQNNAHCSILQRISANPPPLVEWFGLSVQRPSPYFTVIVIYQSSDHF
jgi:hypothetical protein